MNIGLKIKELWYYLKIQDDEILIIKVYNKTNGRDEYIVAEKVNGLIETRQTESIDDIDIDRPFRIIKQRNESGKFEIPSVKQMEHDKLIDY